MGDDDGPSEVIRMFDSSDDEAEDVVVVPQQQQQESETDVVVLEDSDEDRGKQKVTVHETRSSSSKWTSRKSGKVPSSKKKLMEDDGDGEEFVPEMGRRRTSVYKRSRKKVEEFLSEEEDDDEEEMVFHDFSSLELKPDHVIRPIWVLPNKRIILEAGSRFYRQAYDFLVAVAEPVSRPKFIQEYRLTTYSLYAAVSVGLTSENIVSVLDRLSKVILAPEISEFVKECTMNFGKAKLVLRSNRMYVESKEASILQRLLREKTIREARVGSTSFEVTDAALEQQAYLDSLLHIDIEDDVNVDNSDLIHLLLNEEQQKEQQKKGAVVEQGGEDEEEEQLNFLDDYADDDRLLDIPVLEQIDKESREANKVLNFEINVNTVEDIRRAALTIDYPLMEEYEFRKDETSPNLGIELKPTTEIRPYQEKSLSKMFGNGRARSGIIVLPCGAGKTLTGITACCTIKKSCIVLTTGGVAADQWRKQLEMFTTIPKKYIYVFTSKEKNEIDTDTPCVLITTYSMMASKSNRRSAHTAEILKIIGARDWGLMVLDEVHVTPAKLFRKVLTNVKAHCKLGLTATLVREDELIDDLNFLIGPKLYEANWLDLTNAGYLASVLCNEVRCPMTNEFFAEYLHESGIHIKQLLYALNPNKCITADYLVRYHEGRGDKILVFCDNIMAVKQFAELLNRPFISGSTPYRERMSKYNQFRKSTVLGTLVLSKVGDVAIDLPEANVIIQVSSHFGSRRQEAQRLGRILRPKRDCNSGAQQEQGSRYDAYFYTLVSDSTDETYYASKRQQYLVDQGYTYKVRSDLHDIARKEIESLSAPESNVVQLLHLPAQLQLLQKILVLSQSETNTTSGTSGPRRRKTKKTTASSSSSNSNNESAAKNGNEDEDDDDDDNIIIEESESSSDDEESARPVAKRRKTKMDLISGAGTLQYYEYSEEGK